MSLSNLLDYFETQDIKIHRFWEGHKNWQNLHRSIWHLLNNIKSTVEIFSIIVAFLENMNFTWRYVSSQSTVISSPIILLITSG